jgi:hypothetical protein
VATSEWVATEEALVRSTRLRGEEVVYDVFSEIKHG